MFHFKIFDMEGVEKREMVSEEEKMRQERIKCDEAGVKYRCKAASQEGKH